MTVHSDSHKQKQKTSRGQALERLMLSKTGSSSHQAHQAHQAHQEHEQGQEQGQEQREGGEGYALSYCAGFSKDLRKCECPVLAGRVKVLQVSLSRS